MYFFITTFVCVVLLRNPFDEVHHFKAAQNLIKIIQIHYCFGLGIDKMTDKITFLLL